MCFPQMFLLLLTKIKYLLLPKFEVSVLQIMAWKFSLSIYSAKPIKLWGHKTEGKKQGSISYSTNQEDEVSKMCNST